MNITVAQGARVVQKQPVNLHQAKKKNKVNKKFDFRNNVDKKSSGGLLAAIGKFFSKKSQSSSKRAASISSVSDSGSDSGSFSYNQP